MTVTAKQRQSARPPASARISASSGARASAPTPGSGRPTKTHSFPKAARLLKHASFQHVYENGRKHFSATMIFFYVLSPAKDSQVGANAVNIGLTVGRALGGAVDRNRIKRRMRDVVRHNLAQLQHSLALRGMTAEVVINPKKAALTADIATLRAEVQRGFSIIAAANVNSGKSAGETRAR